jgi:hypothetical protein
MKVRVVLWVGLMLFSNAWAGVSPVVPVVLEDDAILLPPYLKSFSGNPHFSLKDQNGKKIALSPNRWLFHGVKMDLIDKMAVQIWMFEGLQVVAGGRTQATFSQTHWNRLLPGHRITANSGWYAVWIAADRQPPSLEQTLEILTPQGTFIATDGIFWLNARKSATDIYVFEGAVQGPDQKKWGQGQFVSFNKKKVGVSRAWDTAAYKIRINGYYPNWISLVEAAGAQWKKGDVRSGYAELRSQKK